LCQLSCKIWPRFLCWTSFSLGILCGSFGAGVAVAKPFLEFFAKALAATDAKL
jgi:hypothetical protein